MKNIHQMRSNLRLAARIWGGIVIGFVSIFLIGAIVDTILGSNEGNGFQNTKEIVTFICFPIFTLLGLGTAFKKEVLGGAIAASSIVVALLIQFVSDLYGNELFSVMEAVKDAGIFLFFILPPGLLFLAYGLMEARNAKL